MRSIAFACAALLTTTACVPEMTADIFVSDILDAGTSSDLTTPVTISFLALQPELCQEKSGNVFTPKDSDMEFTFAGCQEHDFGEYAIVKTQVPIVLWNDESGALKNPISVAVIPNPETTKILLHFNNDQLDEIWASLPEELTFDQPLPTEFRATAKLHNDLLQPAHFLVVSAFVDGQPHPLGHEFTIEYLEHAAITLSDVNIAALRGEAGVAFVAGIERDRIEKLPHHFAPVSE